jgi:hypothetical protein
MAKTSGIIKIEGTVEDLTFYKKDGRNFVRRKGGVSKERIENDPNYVRTRENNSEFGPWAVWFLRPKTANWLVECCKRCRRLKIWTPVRPEVNAR